MSVHGRKVRGEQSVLLIHRKAVPLLPQEKAMVR